VNVSQGGRDDVFGNKGDDTLDVQDGVGNDFVNYDESAKTDPSATAAIRGSVNRRVAYVSSSDEEAVESP